MSESPKTEIEGIETPEWIEKLQQESWQAEILISGGAFVGIIGIISNLESLSAVLTYSTKLDFAISVFLLAGFEFAMLILAEGFLLHLVLRGYWIGVIGISYVFPNGINQARLAFKGKFSTFIKGNSNTPHLIKLDKLCSLLFAFTFFLIFAITGVIFFFILLSLIKTFIPNLHDLPILLRISFRVIMITFLISGLIMLVDFFTFGRLKRIAWFSKIYFTIHYFMSLITLSFLYRRLYYTIVSNIKPWQIIVGLSIPILVMAFAANVESELSKEISPVDSSDDYPFLALKEDVISGKSIQFSITHIPRLEDELLKEWKKEKKNAFVKSFDELKPKDKLKLIENTYEIFVDSVQIKNLAWMIQQHQVLGFTYSKLVSLINLDNFSPGSHNLRVRIRFKTEDLIIERRRKELDCYAKAYFLIDR